MYRPTPQQLAGLFAGARLLDGTILGKFGKAGKQLKEFSTVHEIDCRNPNELFVSEITDWRVQKILLKPQSMKSSGGR